MKLLLVLAGDEPSSGLLRAEMTVADSTIAVDGGLNSFQQLDLTPDLLIGDLDSAKNTASDTTQVVQQDSQETTDLQKSLDYIFQHYKPDQITLLGATGGRTDHLVNNLKICANIDPSIKVVIKNDKVSSDSFNTETIVRVTPEQPNILSINTQSTLSLIHVSEFKGLYSQGLKWEIENANSDSPIISQSNIVKMNDPQFRLDSGCVYLAVYQ